MISNDTKQTLKNIISGTIIEGKNEWRAHIARVKELPKDYQIVYKEIQKYFFITNY